MKTPGSGRKAGTLNKKTLDARTIAQRIGVSPFEVLCWYSKDDWQSLKMKPIVEKDEFGNEIKWSPISCGERLSAAIQACKYLYPQLKALEHSTGEEGLKIIIEDYMKKNDS